MRWLEAKSWSTAIMLLAALGTSVANAQSDRDAQIPQTGTIIAACNEVATTIGEFEDLANSGDAHAAYCLGLTYEIPGYEKYGVRWLKRATHLGSIEAQAKLANVLIETDRKESAQLYLDGAMKGHKDFQLALANIGYRAWKISGEVEHLIFTKAWLTILGRSSIPDIDEKPYLIVNVGALLTQEQREKAEKFAVCIKEHIASYPGESLCCPDFLAECPL